MEKRIIYPVLPERICQIAGGWHIVAALFVCLCAGLAFAGDDGEPASRNGSEWAALNDGEPASRNGSELALLYDDGPIPLIELRGAVGPGMAAFVERITGKLEELGETQLVILIDSPGGRVDSVERISNTLLNTSLKTTTYIERQAISAAALIAISCHVIVMNSAAVMGDAQPVILGTDTPSEKALSWVRSLFRTAAEARGRPKELAEGMVDASLDLEGIAPEGKLVVFTAAEASEAGFCDHIRNSVEDAARAAGLPSEFRLYKASWSENLASMITNPVFVSLLLWIGFIGIFYELMTGQGSGATLAVISFSVFFLGSHVAGLAEWQTVLIFIAGVGFLGAEVFVTPGFGVLGTLGGIMMLASLLLSFPDYKLAIQSLSGAMALTVVAGYFIYRRLPSSRIWSKLVLENDLAVSSGYASPVGDVSVSPGDAGVAVTPLRPVGRAVFNGRKMEVSAESGYIDVDSRLVVTEVRGTRVMVRISDVSSAGKESDAEEHENAQKNAKQVQ